MPELSSVRARTVEPVAAALNAGGCRRSSTPNLCGTNRCVIAVVVYLALLLDNMLLTVIVPILPDYLASINNRTYYTLLDTPGSVSAGHGTANSVTHHLAYRNNYEGPQSSQTIMTKHPIPGKSMVNFSLLHLPEDKMLISVGSNSAAAKSLTINGNGNGNGSSDGANNNKSHHNLSNVLGVGSVPTFAPPTTSNISSTKEDSLADENSMIGILLATKALVQLIFNPIVGNMSSKFGYRLPIVTGTFCLLISSLVFAIGETYWSLMLARAVQGVGSACIGVCGMSLVAQHYPEEDRRSKVMGIILGSIALGVLLGYPFGGILYDLVGKSAPFIILSTIIFLNLGMQLITMDLSVQPEVVVDMDQQQQPKWKPLLESKMILAIVIAIWFSTSTMAILEPCLPIWLIQYLKPTKTQLGTVFIPDSFGYFVGTNFFGSIAYRYGQVKISCISLLLVGISSVLIPSTTTVTQLLLPHFCLGLGIGIIDSALVPLLATFVDATLAQEEEQANADNSRVASANSMSSYGTVYAIQQTSVSLAYFLAPLIGGELAQAIGFPWLMRIVGFFNIAYGPILVCLYQKYDPKTLREKHNEMLLTSTTGRGCSQYKQLYNSVDLE